MAVSIGPLHTNPDRADVVTENAGSVWFFWPQTRKAEIWIARKVDHQGQTNPLEVDHRYGNDIAHAMLDSGLVLQDAATGRTATR